MNIMNMFSLPVARVKPVPFGFSVLYLDREAHHYSATQPKSPVNELNGAKFDVTNATYNTR